MDIESMPVRSRILSMLPSLQTAERRVAEFLLQHAQDGGDLTVSAVAAGSGASAGTVVRTCKSLGYRGYQQVRVLLARDRSLFEGLPAGAPMPPAGSAATRQRRGEHGEGVGKSGKPTEPSMVEAHGAVDRDAGNSTVRGTDRITASTAEPIAVHAAKHATERATTSAATPATASGRDGGLDAGSSVIRHAMSLARRMPALMGMLSTADLDETVRLARESRRVLIVASGLSAPIGQSFASRLLRCGIDVSVLGDVMDQHIAASMLGSDCTAFVISGSGVNAHSLSAARAAKRAGAHVVAMTYFAASPLTSLADISLILEPPDFTFGQELRDVSRVALMILTESIGAQIEQEDDRSGTAFTVISQHLEDDAD